MATALEILQGFRGRSKALQAYTDPELEAAIAIAFLTVERATYGPYTDVAAANLAAHELAAESGSATAAGGQVVTEEQVGPRRRKFASSSTTARPDGLDTSPYGKAYLKYRKMVAFGGLNTGQAQP